VELFALKRANMSLSTRESSQSAVGPALCPTRKNPFFGATRRAAHGLQQPMGLQAVRELGNAIHMVARVPWG
jgi:hypothetical protein